jgi:Cu(I)/Ag(I) efflux system membrane fusion protein
VAVVIALLGAALAAGYWWGAKESAVKRAAVQAGAGAGGKILYYRNPMGLPDTSPVPKKAPDGMDYVPVYADEVGADQGQPPKGKILYYRNPMGLPDTSPVPKKDPMGMDYVPVYAGEEPAAGSAVVKINPDKVQNLGVRTEAAAARALTRTVRAVGTVQADERGLHTVTPKFDGWIQKLYVNTTGQSVTRGQALMDVYSPDLVAAQQEYYIAWKGAQSLKEANPDVQASMRDLMESALVRLSNWDISAGDLQRLQQEGRVRQYVTLRSHASGVVIEKPSVEGKRFMAGEVLYQIADLSSVWVLADVFEQDLAFVHVGQTVKIKVDAFPDKEFAGKVTFIYPTLTVETRTAKVRIELANPRQVLKPAMYARVEVASGSGNARSLAVPDSAVLDTGTRQLVLVQRGEGVFEPREIKTGMRADGYIEVLEGLKTGEMVVVSANFLIDAESNLKAALSSMGGTPMPAKQGSGAAEQLKDARVADRKSPASEGEAVAPHKGH